MAASDRNPPSDRPAAGEFPCLSAEALRRRLAEEVNRAGRHGTPLSCLLVTIGNLEELAREHGDELSEQTLAYVASVLAGQVRGFDRVGRPSDSELLLVLPGADGPRGEIVARRVLERLRTIKVESDGAAPAAAHLRRSRRLAGGHRRRRSARAGARGGAPRQRRRRRVAAAPAPLPPCLAGRTDLHNQSVLSGSELWLLRLMADRGLALLDADTLLIVIEERGELRVAASAGSSTMRVRIVPVDGSALGELYSLGQVPSARPPARQGRGVAARTRRGGSCGARRAAEPGGPGRRHGDRAAHRRQLSQPRPRGAAGLLDERRPAPRGRAHGGDPAASLRHGGARARAHPLGARDPRREHPGHGRAAPAPGQRARHRRPGSSCARRSTSCSTASATRSTACAT